MSSAQPLRERRNNRGNHFLNLFTNDANGTNHILEGNSTLPASAGVEKKLLIAFGARQMTGAHAEDFEGQLNCRGRNTFDGFLMRLRVADDATFADFALFQFELWFYED